MFFLLLKEDFSMRPVRTISAEEENFRIEKIDYMEVCRQDPVKPEPEGTIILMAFKITGYDRDCDGSLMTRLAHINKDGEESGWEPSNIGLYPDSDLVVTQEEFQKMFMHSYNPQNQEKRHQKT